MWWTALGAAGMLAGSASPDRHWSARNGLDWRALGPDARAAYADGFLAGVGFAQAAGGWSGAGTDSGRHAPGVSNGWSADSARLDATMGTLHRSGKFRFPYAASVYVTRLNDYYWWENHRPLPTWYAFWEVNTSLIGPMNDTAR